MVIRRRESRASRKLAWSPEELPSWIEWLDKWDELVKKEPSFVAQTFSHTTMEQWKKVHNCSQVPNKNQTWNSETPVKLTK